MNNKQVIIRHQIERPDYRDNDKYQFVKGYTGGGAEMCVHLSRDEISERCRKQLGPGVLVDDEIDLWWEQKETDGKRIIVPLTDKEHEILMSMSKDLDLAPERVMIQALRYYQSMTYPVNNLSKIGSKNINNVL